MARRLSSVRSARSRGSRSRSRRAPRGGVLLAALILLAVALIGVYRSSSDVPAPQDTGSAGQSEAHGDGDATALALLDTLAVKGKSPRTGYDREEKFGSAWIDVDNNGCDTRNDILARDLTEIVLGERCRVLSGTIDDPYTGDVIHFVRGDATSALVQIDHVVALSNAWQTGAQQLSEQMRIALANDPLNLLAVDGAANSQKGDGDTATWLPQNTAFRCDYVARQVAVKVEYHLWVTPAEHDAMSRVLERCPEETVPQE